MMRVLFILGLLMVVISCSKKSETAQDDLNSAYANDLMYKITSEGIGNINLGGAFELVENNLPVAEMENAYEEEDDSGLYLIRLAESDEFNLSVQVGYGDIIAMTVLTPPFTTEKGISPKTSNLADLKNYYTIEDLWVPNAGVLHIGVKELPNITFVFEEKNLLTLTEGAEIQLADLPGGLVLTKIELYKAVQ
ncbi:MAG: hypothetical protein KF846_04235 [Cyclobacteriaceae bacterium]|nr:hypothetical protein [Cyclobacteriaceae bacterium]MBX2955338.1 hypothetical protein [Cyclobacteriaceae bacterium]